MTIKTPKHPDVTVKVWHLRGDNAAIIIECLHAMKKCEDCARITTVCKTCCKSRDGETDRQHPKMV